MCLAHKVGKTDFFDDFREFALNFYIVTFFVRRELWELWASICHAGDPVEPITIRGVRVYIGRWDRCLGILPWVAEEVVWMFTNFQWPKWGQKWTQTRILCNIFVLYSFCFVIYSFFSFLVILNISWKFERNIPVTF